MITWYWWGIIGLLLGFLATKWAIKFFPGKNLLDFPERYNLKRAKLPYPGGIILAILSCLIILIDLRFWIILPSLLILLAISFIDDRKPLPASLRLFSHLFSALLVYFLGVEISTISHPWLDTNILWLSDLLFFPLIITVIWIVFIQNALNWFDGLKGLSVGTSGIGFFILGLLILIKPELFLDQGQHILLSANFFLAGLCFGSWWLYFRGKILLGDSGSQTLGFLLAIMAIFSGAKIATTLLFLLLPLVDVIFSIWRRWKTGKNIFHGDIDHLHHLLKRKISEKIAVLVLLFLSLCFGLIAIFGDKTLKFTTLLTAIIMIWLVINWLYDKEK